MDLSEFLLARIAEDEAVARAALGRSAYEWADTAFAEALELAENEGARKPATEHIARHDPARVLAECDTKRRIVEDASFVGEYAAALLLRVGKLLAVPYADHPDYDPEWKV